jgi:hypothetical protein
MKHCLAILLAAILVPSCATSSSLHPSEMNKQLVELQKQKDKLTRQTDPVKRTKTQIKISEILIALTSDAVRSGALEDMDQRLDEYVSTIQDAHQTMMNTGRDAHKKPAGFRDLEIALRQQINQLDDVGKALNFDQRDPVDKARDEATRIRDDLLKAIFGNSNVTSRRS